MGFDAETFAPTYRILMGVPGQSHALQIARRSGMPENVLDSAFSYLDDERTDISRLVSHLAERTRSSQPPRREQGAGARAAGKEAHDGPEGVDAPAERAGAAPARPEGASRFHRPGAEGWESCREKTGAPSGSDFSRLARGIQARIESEEKRIEEEREALSLRRPSICSPGMEVSSRGRAAGGGRCGRTRRALDRGDRDAPALPAAGELRPAPPAAPPRRPADGELHCGGAMDPPVFELQHPGHEARRGNEARRKAGWTAPSARPAGVQQLCTGKGRAFSGRRSTTTSEVSRPSRDSGFPAGGRRFRTNDRHSERMITPTSDPAPGRWVAIKGTRR